MGKHVSRESDDYKRSSDVEVRWKTCGNVTAAEVQSGDVDTKCLIFVDDSIAELLDNQVVAIIPGLARVLFCRVLA